MKKDEKDKIIKDLVEEFPIYDEIKFSDLDILEKLKDNPFMIVKYKELYLKEKVEYDKLVSLYDSLVGERYKYYRFDDQKEWTKIEIERYCIPNDKKVLKMKEILRKQEIRMKFFELCAKGMEQQGWRMKSWIDHNKFGG